MAMDASKITVETPMQAIMEALPGAKRALFAAYHLGGCSSCAFSNEETLAELAKRSEVDPAEMLKQLLDSHEHDMQMLVEPQEIKLEEWRVLDVRTREEFEAVNIDGSELMTQELQQKVFSEDKQQRILLVDHQGKHVLDQVAWFRGHGLKQTFGLRGGIDVWSVEVDASLQRYRIELD